jgi:hypothetical protein
MALPSPEGKRLSEVALWNHAVPGAGGALAYGAGSAKKFWERRSQSGCMKVTFLKPPGETRPDKTEAVQWDHDVLA